jgi:hypothetical protein
MHRPQIARKANWLSPVELLIFELEAKRPPFNGDRAFPKAKWLKPELLADVECRRRTAKRRVLRHRSYEGLREEL